MNSVYSDICSNCSHETHTNALLDNFEACMNSSNDAFGEIAQMPSVSTLGPRKDRPFVQNLDPCEMSYPHPP